MVDQLVDNQLLTLDQDIQNANGFCFDCADAESVIVEGVDMYDNEITREEGMSMSMSKVKWILKKFNVINKK